MHDDRERGPDDRPVEHTEVAAKLVHLHPGRYERGAKDLAEPTDEGQDQAGLKTTLVVCEDAERGVVEEQRDEARDHEHRALGKDQDGDGQELSHGAGHEAEGDGVGGTKAKGDGAVDAGHGTLEELVENALEGNRELCDEGTLLKFQAYPLH